MTEQTTHESQEPKILRQMTPSEGVLTTLYQHLLWEVQGKRDLSATARYVYIGDAAISLNNSEITFEEFTLPENGGAVVDGIKVTLTPKNGGFREMPVTDEEELQTDVYIERLESELRSCKASHQQMQEHSSRNWASRARPARADGPQRLRDLPLRGEGLGRAYPPALHLAPELPPA